MIQDLTGMGKLSESLEKGTQELRQLIYDFLSPSCKEAGELLADKVRYLRFRNATKAMRKAKQLLAQNGIVNEGIHIEMRNLFPLIEKCSLEEDDYLVDKWAGLIASASTDKNFTSSYINILSSLNAQEALVLDTINDLSEPAMKSWSFRYHGAYVEKVKETVRLDMPVLIIILGNLERLGLITRVQKDEPALVFGNPPLGTIGNDMVGLTPLGANFLFACCGNVIDKRIYGPIVVEEPLG